MSRVARELESFNRGRRGILPVLGAVAMLLVLHGSGCRSGQVDAPPKAKAMVESPPWFVDVSDAVGLNSLHQAGTPKDAYFMPRIMGSGAALFDFDNDGRLDLYLLQNGGPGSTARHCLLRQSPEGKFLDVSAGSGLDGTGYGMGVAVADVNNDGLPDVCVTEYGATRLFLNLGQGRFKDISRSAGIENPLWGTSASFVDFDRDGWLDLLVVNYLDYDPTKWCGARDGKQDFCHRSTFESTAARLFRNTTRSGQEVRFADVSLAAGVGKLPGPALVVVCADFTGDGWPDLFVANDSRPNHLWINQRNGTFLEEARLRGVAFNSLGQSQANMGIALGDVDGNGTFDLFVTHLSEETHALWKLDQGGVFQERTAAAGLVRPHWRGTGFGTIFADFDHDGALDLAIENGRVVRDPLQPQATSADFWSPYAERNQLFVNDGTGRFRDISAVNVPFCSTAAVGRGLAWGDFDNDGAVDLLVTSIAERARLFRNVIPARGHWLQIRAVAPDLGGRDAYGAEITIHAGQRRWIGLVNPSQSYLVSGDPRVHFRLGQVDQVEYIQIRWPDGSTKTFPGSPVDRQITLHKGTGSGRKGTTP